MSWLESFRIARRYRWPWHKQYGLAKLLADPLYAAVAPHLLAADDANKPLLDIGCGIGLLAGYLRRRGFRAPIHGFDFDARKIEAAKHVADESMHFHLGDARDGLTGFRGHVALLDVLQYLQPEQQQTLLRQAARAVAPGGVFVIRSGMADDSWRYRASLWGDHFAKLVVWMKSAPVRYPSADGVRALLQEDGLTGEFQPLWGRTPFNNYLGVFRRGA